MGVLEGGAYWTKVDHVRSMPTANPEVLVQRELLRPISLVSKRKARERRMKPTLFLIMRIEI
jgi:hypothetical protein